MAKLIRIGKRDTEAGYEAQKNKLLRAASRGECCKVDQEFPVDLQNTQYKKNCVYDSVKMLIKQVGAVT